MFKEKEISLFFYFLLYIKMKLGRFTVKTETFWNNVFVYILKDNNIVTKAQVENDENLNKNIRFLLVNDYTYNRKYDLMKIFYNNWEIDYWKAREKAQKTIEYVRIEKEKKELLEKY